MLAQLIVVLKFVAFFFAVAAAVYLFENWRSGRGLGFKQLFAFCFPKSIYGTRHFVIDFAIKIINSAVIGSAVVYLADRGLFFRLARGIEDRLAGEYAQALKGALGGFFVFGTNGIVADVAYTIAWTLVIDFAQFVSHCALHRVPFLWEFHKVHHAPQALNPLVGSRRHPFEIFINRAVDIFFVVIISVGFFTLLPHKPSAITLLGIPLYYLISRPINTFAHSHLWISFGPVFSYVICSPAMHQIHHSKEPRHLHKNLTRVFPLWDWLAGTLYIPQERETFRMGLEDEKEQHILINSVVANFTRPIKKSFSTLLPTAVDFSPETPSSRPS